MVENRPIQIRVNKSIHYKSCEEITVILFFLFYCAYSTHPLQKTPPEVISLQKHSVSSMEGYYPMLCVQ